MKPRTVFVAAMSVVPAGTFVLAGIEGSKHDFSLTSWSKDEICRPCHTSHDASGASAAPLWDHAPSARKSYTMYGGVEGAPGLASLACLSCHDGSTAVDSYGGVTGDVFIQDLAQGRGLIGGGGDLATDHPVGVTYPSFDPKYRPRSLIEAEGLVPLPNGRVECTSCHDVHGEYELDKLLVKSNRRSALCLTCHQL